METDTITPLDWLKDDIDEKIDSTTMSYVVSDDGSQSTYTTGNADD